MTPSILSAMKTTAILFIAIFLTTVQKSLADSPITSTAFSKAYHKEAIVMLAAKAHGKINTELMDYLAGRNPIDIKVALINELGWEGEGKVNANIFAGYLMKSKGYMTEAELQRKAKPDDLLCIAYLKAMDNYFDVSKAITYADLAISKNSKSYTYQIITSLIKAQAAMEQDWCAVYSLTDRVRANKDLKLDMKAEASKLIFDYMDEYKAYCQKASINP